MRSIRCAGWIRSGRSGRRFTGPSATLLIIRKWTPRHPVNRSRAPQGLIGGLCPRIAVVQPVSREINAKPRTRCPFVVAGQPRTGGSLGPGGRGAVAVQGFGAVGAAGGGGAVRMEGDGPAPLVNGHMMVKEAVERTSVDAGLAAVGQVGHVVDLTG